MTSFKNFPSVVNPLTYINGTNGFMTNSTLFSNVGDVNNNGYSDFFMAHDNGNGPTNQASIIYGQSSAFPAVITNPTQLNGCTLSSSTWILNAAYRLGDVDGDRIDDFIVELGNSNGSLGSLLVVYGKNGSFPALLNVDNLLPQEGFCVVPGDGKIRINFIDYYAQDVNCDGRNDVLVESDVGFGYTTSSILFGASKGYYSTIKITSNGLYSNGIPGGLNLFQYNSASGVGDISGDGCGDLMSGYPYFDPSHKGAYIIFGNPNLGGNYDIFNITLLNGININAGGVPLIIVGKEDFDGDGINDLALTVDNSTTYFPTQANALIYGSATLPKIINYFSLNGNDGFYLISNIIFEEGGYSVILLANDLTGDGKAEFVIYPCNNMPFASCVIYGFNDRSIVSFDTSILDGTNGFQIINSAYVYESFGNTYGDNKNGIAGYGIVGNPPQYAYSYTLFNNETIAPLPQGPVSDYVYATLSLEVYDDPNDNGILPPGRLPRNPATSTKWKVLDVCQVNTNDVTFHSKFYSDGTNLVYGIRGTYDLEELIGEDSEILFSLVPDYFNYVISCLNNGTAAYPNMPLTVTGHSLGGFLAQLTAQKYGINAVTFESPGVSLTLSKAIASGDSRFAGVVPNWGLVKSYVAAPDLINIASGQHLETMIRAYPTYNPADDIFTLQQHRMGNIYTMFNPNTGNITISSNMNNYWVVNGVTMNWPYVPGYTPPPPAPGNEDAVVEVLNNLLNTAFFENYDQNPYYYEVKFKGYPVYQRANCLPFPWSSYCPPASTNYAKVGVVINGDNKGSLFFGGTNFADRMNGGTGNDTYYPFGGNNVITDQGGFDTYIFVPYNMGGITVIYDNGNQGLIGYDYIASDIVSNGFLQRCFINTVWATGTSGLYVYIPSEDNYCNDKSTGNVYFLNTNSSSLLIARNNLDFEDQTLSVANFAEGDFGITYAIHPQPIVIVNNEKVKAPDNAIVITLKGNNLVETTGCDKECTIIKTPDAFDIYLMSDLSQSAIRGAFNSYNLFFVGLNSGNHVFDYSNANINPNQIQISVQRASYNGSAFNNGTATNETIYSYTVTLTYGQVSLVLNNTNFYISTFDQQTFYYLNASTGQSQNLLDVPNINATAIIDQFDQAINPVTPPSNHNDDHTNNNAGAIAGGVIGTLAGVSVFAVAGWYAYHKGYFNCMKDQPLLGDHHDGYGT
jgi:hypothetical protein